MKLDWYKFRKANININQICYVQFSTSGHIVGNRSYPFLVIGINGSEIIMNPLDCNNIEYFLSEVEKFFMRIDLVNEELNEMLAQYR